jgi:hypothetical protein
MIELAAVFSRISRNTRDLRREVDIASKDENISEKDHLRRTL